MNLEKQTWIPAVACLRCMYRAFNMSILLSLNHAHIVMIIFNDTRVLYCSQMQFLV